jgi:hypothetical protein
MYSDCCTVHAYSKYDDEQMNFIKNALRDGWELELERPQASKLHTRANLRVTWVTQVDENCKRSEGSRF